MTHDKAPTTQDHTRSPRDMARELAVNAQMNAEDAAIFGDDETLASLILREAEAKLTRDRNEARAFAEAYGGGEDMPQDVADQAEATEASYLRSKKALEDPTTAKEILDGYRASVKVKIIEVLRNPTGSEGKFGQRSVQHYKNLAIKIVEDFKPENN